MKSTKDFLALYRSCEEALRIRFPSSRGESSPFFYLEEITDDICLRRSIRAAREVRNLLSHTADFRGEELVTPSEKLISFLEDLLVRIENESRAGDIMTPSKSVICFTSGTAPDEMASRALSSSHERFPFLDEKGRIVKVITLRSMLWEMTEKGKGEENPYEEKPLFVPVSATADSILTLLKVRKTVFVTQSGKKTEKLLGLITQKDIFPFLSSYMI